MIAPADVFGPTAAVPSERRTGGLLPPSSLLFVSNRGPIQYRSLRDGHLVPSPGNGGVVTALSAAAARAAGIVPVTWISAAMCDGDRLAAKLGCAERGTQCEAPASHFVTAGREAFRLHYDVFSNPVLWFLQHGLWTDLSPARSPADISAGWHAGYVEVNRQFALSIAQAAESQRRPFVLVQDYHLYIVPSFVRGMVPSAMIAHFVHIPWPEAEQWQHLPETIVRAIFSGVASSHLVGFQTNADAHRFLRGCAVFLEGSTVDITAQRVLWRGGVCDVRAYPISVDVARLQSHLYSPSTRLYRERLAGRSDEVTIVRVDRLDPTKNIVRGFKALHYLLAGRPDLIGRLRFLAFLVPSRSQIPEYARYHDEVMAAAAEVNDCFGRDGWKPVHVYYEDNYDQALAALSLYDVLLVNPLADGMNLVAKEGPVVNQRNGVLVLSNKAGVWHQLQAGALSIDPLDVPGTARALADALAMPAIERARRLRLLRSAVSGYDVGDWLWRQIGDLASFQPDASSSPRLSSISCRKPSAKFDIHQAASRTAN